MNFNQVSFFPEFVHSHMRMQENLFFMKILVKEMLEKLKQSLPV